MTTPMMAQWQACKAKARGAILLFRLGDFYEAFEDDAALVAEELEITLTRRQEIPMAGIPAHTVEGYLDRLVNKGYRVAIAEQVEDPGLAKGLVKREIVRLITPGSIVRSSLLKEKVSNFMVAITSVNSLLGMAALDVTTADFRVMEFSEKELALDELSRLKPKEVLVSEKAWKGLQNRLASLSIPAIQVQEEAHFDLQNSLQTLLRQFQVHSLDGFGIQGMVAAISSAGALLRYMTEELFMKLPHLKSIHPIYQDGFLWLDQTTERHLEVLEPLHEKGISLLSILDTTLTPMGGRLLKEWLTHPLTSPEEIRKRQDEVEIYYRDDTTRELLRKALKRVRDLERLIMRIETGCTSPKEVVQLRLSLEPLPTIASLVPSTLEDLTPLENLIARAVVDEPPLQLHEGGVFKKGYHAELDQLSQVKTDSQTWLASYQAQLRDQLQIKTLKVTYSEQLGYSIEVSRGQAEKMPATFQRRQTLVSSERFISHELKEFEHKMFSAEEKISALEQQLFQKLILDIAAYAPKIRLVAKTIAHLDVICSFADVARNRSYVRPIVDESRCLEITAGRHPVVEAVMGQQLFVPNDLLMDGGEEQLLVITGPNMGGKSTFLRQTALLVLMAQMGCFIPVSKARIGVIDKLFTRMGAGDRLTSGQSTFMVEMNETAYILHNATSRSLIILDEIGRGTSTYDGIAIAWAVAHYLLTTEGKKGKTLFATHYFELTKLEQEVKGAVNYTVSTTESDEEIVFLHRIIRGAANKSHGLQVAKLAGLPSSVLQKAGQMLDQLGNNLEAPKKEELQLELF